MRAWSSLDKTNRRHLNPGLYFALQCEYYFLRLTLLKESVSFWSLCERHDVVEQEA